MASHTLAHLSVLSLLAVGYAACESTTTPAAPSSTLTGSWTGAASDTSGPGQMTWQITQTGASFSGTLAMTDATTGIVGRGSVSGSVGGASIHFVLSIPAGGFGEPYGSCSAEVSGDAELSASSIRGSYTGTNSCTGAIASGQLTLARS